MHCCSNCFSDNFLQIHIRAISNKKGKCSFCKTRNHFPLLEPSVLIDLFQPLFDLYTEKSNGELLNELLQSDWHIFSKFINKYKQLQFLSIITDDNNIQSKRFLSNLTLNKSFVDKWDTFTKELKHENRFFPKKAIEISQLSELFNYLIMQKEEIPKYIYRARINRESRNLSINEMGKPPLEKSKDGRANPKGISYFYGTSDEKTAIAETRPYKSEKVCVAKFKVKKVLSLIDLRDPKSSISPFGLDDDSLTLLYEEHMLFFVHLGSALSKPVLPYNTELEYLSTQYLCELIKKNSFHGIVYKSSLENGDNYVFFDDSFLTGTKVETFIVSDITIKSVKVNRKK